jgi:hypothetical protein
MNGPAGFVLAAQSERLDEIVRRFGEGFSGKRIRWDQETVILWCVIGLTVFLAFWLLGRMLQRQDWVVPYHSPRRLFFALCRAHHLRIAERWLLWRLTRYYVLSDPAQVFLDPRYLAAASLPPSLQAKRAQFESLRLRLFDGIDEPANLAAQETPTAGSTMSSRP